MRALKAILLVVFISVPFAFAYGQEDASRSCPAYSGSGDIATTLSTELSGTVPGVSVGVRATLHNTSGSAIYDGTLVARVTNTSNAALGVVDEFVALEEIDLAIDETKEEVFIWKVSPRAPTGDYRVEVFFVHPRSPFIPAPSVVSQDVASLTMHVESEERTQVRIEQEHISVSGAVQSESGYAYEAGMPITVSVPIRNATDAPYKGTITWRVYERGKGPRAIPVAESVDEVKAHPLTTVEKTYTVSDTSGSSYYLEADLSDGTSQSIIGIMLMPEGVCASATAEDESGSQNKSLWVFVVVFVGALIGYAILQKWTLSRS